MYSLDIPRSVGHRELIQNVLLHRQQHSVVGKQSSLFTEYRHFSFGFLAKLNS